MTGKRVQPSSPIGSPSNSDNSPSKETVQESISKFISFVTGEASDKCQREKWKIINGDDLLWAMTTLRFEDYVGPLKVYLKKYREIECDKNNLSSNNSNTNLTLKDDHHHLFYKETKALPDIQSMSGCSIVGDIYSFNHVPFDKMNVNGD